MGLVGWGRRVAGWVAPVVVGSAVFGVSVAGVEGFIGVRSAWDQPWLLGCCAVCGAAAGLARWWRWPLYVVAAVAGIVLLLWPATLVASYYAGSTLRGRRLAGFTAGAVGCYAVSVAVNAVVGGYRGLWASPPNAAIQLIVFVGLPLTVGMWVDARRRLLAELRDRADRLEREQAVRADRARITERARIAREMHDVLAHRVSLMVLHAGAIEVTATDERLAGEAALIRTTGRTALAELRQVLGVLRTSETTGTAPQPLLSDLDTLLAASRAAGVPVTQHLTTTPADPARPAGPVDPAVLAGLAPGVQRTAYRVVQEALTNVHKHAGRAATEVTVDHRPDRLLVTVRNAAPGAPVEPPAAGGLGLAGLRERVALLGGTCRAGTDPDGGFTVHAELPLAPATTLGVGV